METQLIRQNINGNSEPDGIRRAAELLRMGGLVAIPTETVYGLAANALNPVAVARIFKAKGRPQDNPLIVHLASPEDLPPFVLEVPGQAKKLMEAFWPGPLTIILPKSTLIPDIVSAGLETAAFRMPSHPVANAIIRAAGVPLAAPSANLSGSPSPTRAEHVLADLNGRIEAVVDGGECGVGVESTVVTLAGGVARVLRPGGVTPEQIEKVLGDVQVDDAVLNPVAKGERVASPGMKYKHYAPKAHVTILEGELEAFLKYVRSHSEPGTGVLCFEGEQGLMELPSLTYGHSGSSEEQARRLFDALRGLDELGVSRVFARAPSKTGVGLAVYNRLLRAAAFEVIRL